jgi:hypothetical protein
MKRTSPLLVFRTRTKAYKRQIRNERLGGVNATEIQVRCHSTSRDGVALCSHALHAHDACDCAFKRKHADNHKHIITVGLR